jgi:putative membrane protein
MKTLHRKLLRLSPALLLATLSVANAQQQPTERTDTPPAAGNPGSNAGATGEIDRKDRLFIQEAGSGGMAEVELGKLAQSQGASDEVRQFGSQMQQDHGKANDELREIAKSKGIHVAAEPDQKSQETMKSLGKSSGAEFDRRYTAEMLRDHEKNLKAFQERAKNSRDPQIKAFAEKTSKVIAMHLQHVKQLAKKVGNAGTTGAAGSTAAPASPPQTTANGSRAQQ